MMMAHHSLDFICCSCFIFFIRQAPDFPSQVKNPSRLNGMVLNLNKAIQEYNEKKSEIAGLGRELPRIADICACFSPHKRFELIICSIYLCMDQFISLPDEKLHILKEGRLFVPSPLALTEHLVHDEAYQRLLTLYYIRAGAAAVVPGAHTGEFALGNLDIFRNWLIWVKEMVMEYGENMILIAAIGGNDFMKQAEFAAHNGYDLALVAPTVFKGKNPREVAEIMREIAGIIPTLGFELQRSIPGAYDFSSGIWSSLFEISYGAKGASFDTYRSLVMLEAAARSSRRNSLALLTGNDDRIVEDLSGEFDFNTNGNKAVVRYHGGLLGHLATDTHAAKLWIDHIFHWRNAGNWQFSLSRQTLAHAVNRCNMALFDALGNFENSVWGVKYRLHKLGLLPGPWCAAEKGRSGQAEAIDAIYGEYAEITDETFVRDNLEMMEKEVGMTLKRS
jgi:hypothetical protein